MVDLQGVSASQILVDVEQAVSTLMGRSETLLGRVADELTLKDLLVAQPRELNNELRAQVGKVIQVRTDRLRLWQRNGGSALAYAVESESTFSDVDVLAVYEQQLSDQATNDPAYVAYRAQRALEVTLPKRLVRRDLSALVVRKAKLQAKLADPALADLDKEAVDAAKTTFTDALQVVAEAAALQQFWMENNSLLSAVSRLRMKPWFGKTLPRRFSEQVERGFVEKGSSLARGTESHLLRGDVLQGEQRQERRRLFLDALDKLDAVAEPRFEALQKRNTPVRRLPLTVADQMIDDVDVFLGDAEQLIEAVGFRPADYASVEAAALRVIELNSVLGTVRELELVSDAIVAKQDAATDFVTKFPELFNGAPTAGQSVDLDQEAALAEATMRSSSMALIRTVPALAKQLQTVNEATPGSLL